MNPFDENEEHILDENAVHIDEPVTPFDESDDITNIRRSLYFRVKTKSMASMSLEKYLDDEDSSDPTELNLNPKEIRSSALVNSEGEIVGSGSLDSTKSSSTLLDEPSQLSGKKDSQKDLASALTVDTRSIQIPNVRQMSIIPARGREDSIASTSKSNRKSSRMSISVAKFGVTPKSHDREPRRLHRVASQLQSAADEELEATKNMTKEEKMEYILNKPLENRTKANLDYIKAQTANVAMFQRLDKEQYDMVCAMIRIEIFAKEQIIFKEGEVGDKFYIVLSGQVDVLKRIIQKKKDSSTHEAKNKRVALLESGTYFGELALIRSVPRACTCKALSRVACAVLTKNDYQALLMQSDKLELANKMDVLKKSSLFEGCTDKELSYFSYFFQKKRYGRGSYLLKERSGADPNLFIIAQGQCQVIAMDKEEHNSGDVLEMPVTIATLHKEKPTPLQSQRCDANFYDKHTPTPIVFSTLVEGQYFGTEYIFNKETIYHEAVIASTEVHCYVMSKEDFFKRLRPSILSNIKAMTILRKKWRLNRAAFLTDNITAQVVNANIHREVPKNPLVVASNANISEKRNLERIAIHHANKEKVDLRKHIPALLTPIKSINAGPITFKDSRKKSQSAGSLALIPPHGVHASSAREELQKLDTTGILTKNPYLGAPLSSVAPSKRYATLFALSRSSPSGGPAGDNAAGEPPEEICTLYRSFGTWKSSRSSAVM